MPLRNIGILTCCQLISATGSFAMITLGGLIGVRLAPDPTLATLPVSMTIIFTAATTVPATMLMRRIGRRRGFSLASTSAAVAALVAAYALHLQNFYLFIAGTSVFGINLAFTQQYRYAAAESVPAEHSPRAISFVLLGAIGGALVGQQLVKLGRFALSDVEYTGTLVGIAVLYAVQALLFFTLGPLRGEGVKVAAGCQRPLGEIIRQPAFIVAVLGGLTAYGVMTFVMTATPLSMTVHDGYPVDDMTNVIRNHVLGMYLPSLISGILIERFGVVRLMSVGALGLVAACLIGLNGQSYMHYWYALVLLGVGWNFLYVGGTAMLTRTYAIEERFRAQAVNEFTVFGMSATGSLLAGMIIYSYGWHTLVMVPLPLLALTLTGLFLVRKDPLILRGARPATA